MAQADPAALAQDPLRCPSVAPAERGALALMLTGHTDVVPSGDEARRS